MLHAVLMFVHFLCAVGIVLLVLLQRGKGADAGAGFGSGASGTVFGARGATTALSRATAVLAALFMVTSLSLAYVGSRATTTSNSLLDRLSQQQHAPAAPKSLPRRLLPGQVPPLGAPSSVGQAPPAAPPSSAPNAPSSGAAPSNGGGAANNAAAPAPSSSAAPRGNGAGGNSTPH
jgi:preprotein translocase subunit SecG